MSIAYPPTPATLDDLYKVDGKAELIAGRIVRFMASGSLPGRVALNIAIELRLFERQSRRGMAYGDNVGFALPVPLVNGRQSFCPDAAFYTGPLPANEMRFIPGTPDFAVEVRSENDYSPAALRDQSQKRKDYFEAGTQVVWDVDPVAGTVACYRAAAPDAPAVFGRGDIADAEPALPGWRVPVETLFA